MVKKTPKPYIFRVIREKVGNETIRVLLQPYNDDNMVHIDEGDEFITGTLNTDPWPEP
jgi:hypothetical protein